MKAITKAAVALAFVLATASALAEPKLAGEWQSDRIASNAFNRSQTRLEDKTLAFLEQSMGRLVLRFSATEVVSEMPGWISVSQGLETTMKGFRDSSPYEVVATTAQAVAVKMKEPVTGTAIVQVFNFVSPDVMWIYVGGADKSFPDLHIREYFRRVR